MVDHAALPESVVIPERFNGPPESGHGGYSCFAAAQFVDGPAEVTLKAPPPLARELRVDEADGVVRLFDGETLVAEARPAAIDVGDPPRVSREDAREASRGSWFRDVDNHPFPTCFACGPLREPGDGLRIFVGPAGGDVHADVWTPPGDGPELVWSALDCPTSAPAFADGRGERLGPFVLAQLAVRIDGELRPGEEHVVVSWHLEGEEHKQRTAAALLGPDGEPVAVARALWIGLRGRKAP